MSHTIVVGVDLAIGHLSPLRFATWWAEVHRAGGDVLAAHVLPKSTLDELMLVDPRFGDPRVRESLALAAESVVPPPTRNVVVHARSVEDGLTEICAEHGAELLVIGRRRFETGPSWLRLGSVARHLVHRLPTPVVIVPREWKPSGGTRGSVLAMIAPEASSLPALHAAARHADGLDVPLVVAHAIEDPEPELLPYFPPGPIEELRLERRTREGAEFERWFADQRLPSHPELVLQLGSARHLAASLCERTRPSLVVVGSRGVPLRERWFGGSTSTDLAAHLDAPVLVVPGNDHP
jgi:nucleotide-binding universal stress UspA family protein